MMIIIQLNILDHNGKTDKAFAIAASNDTEAKPATTTLSSPGFIGKEHPQECLNFWFDVKVKWLKDEFKSIFQYFSPIVIFNDYNAL